MGHFTVSGRTHAIQVHGPVPQGGQNKMSFWEFVNKNSVGLAFWSLIVMVIVGFGMGIAYDLETARERTTTPTCNTVNYFTITSCTDPRMEGHPDYGRVGHSCGKTLAYYQCE